MRGLSGRWMRVLGLAGAFLTLPSGGQADGWGLGPRPALGAESPAHQRERARIAALLDAVERSGAQFIREGREYPPGDARKHLERKLRHAGDSVQTAEEFIEGIASRSSLTGRPYQVRLPSGEQMESGSWMQQRLAEIDARR